MPSYPHHHIPHHPYGDHHQPIYYVEEYYPHPALMRNEHPNNINRPTTYNRGLYNRNVSLNFEERDSSTPSPTYSTPERSLNTGSSFPLVSSNMNSRVEESKSISPTNSTSFCCTHHSHAQPSFTDVNTSYNLQTFANSTGFNDIVVHVNTNQQQTNDSQASFNGKDRYKTELCRSWEETGQCRYGDKCQFAHGRNELRMVTRHHKYKSELCNNYHYEGTCMYGTRCCFIHSIDETLIGRALSQNIDLVPIKKTKRLPVFEKLTPSCSNLHPFYHQSNVHH
ncbi:hypothetical protein ABK040_013159 [Willaertia magna]